MRLVANSPRVSTILGLRGRPLQGKTMNNVRPWFDWQFVEDEDEWQRCVAHDDSAPEAHPADVARRQHLDWQVQIATAALLATLILLMSGRYSLRPPAVRNDGQNGDEGAAGTMTLAIAYIEPWQTITTAHFTFTFVQSEAAMVAPVARAAEPLYAALRHAVGLPKPSADEQIAIHIAPAITHPSAIPFWQSMHDQGRRGSQIFTGYTTLASLQAICTSHSLQSLVDEQPRSEESCPSQVSLDPIERTLTIPSPRLRSKPDGVSHADALVQALADQLAGRALAEALHGKRIAAGWSPLLAGMRLWLSRHTRTALLGFAPKDWQEGAVPMVQPGPCDFVADLLSVDERTMAAATIINFGMCAYGRDKLPTLLAALAQYDSWHVLIPAVFGVSAEEFEHDWQEHLRARYGDPS